MRYDTKCFANSKKKKKTHETLKHLTLNYVVRDAKKLLTTLPLKANN